VSNLSTNKYLLSVLLCCLLAMGTTAQQNNKRSAVATDTSAVTKKDTSKIIIHSPRTATIRSAMIPGWGQAYNKKYWKIPLVYGALGTCVGFFIYNRNEYVAARDAYRYKMDNDPSNDALINPKFRPIDPEAVRQYRNAIRQNVDYSVLAFLVCWGLNVVDATVDGHLNSFEVNDNLSLRIKPGYQPQTQQKSVGLVFTFGSKQTR